MIQDRRVKTQWQLQQAKSQFCAVAAQAVRGRPQFVTKHGRPFVVIVGATSWRKAHARTRSPMQALRRCPADLSGLDLSRSREQPREVAL